VVTIKDRMGRKSVFMWGEWRGRGGHSRWQSRQHLGACREVAPACMRALGSATTFPLPPYQRRTHLSACRGEEEPLGTARGEGHHLFLAARTKRGAAMGEPGLWGRKEEEEMQRLGECWHRRAIPP